jgi:hypothetical protein
MRDEITPNWMIERSTVQQVIRGVVPIHLGVISQCVGEMIFCVHEPQYAAQDASFGYNI